MKKVDVQVVKKTTNDLPVYATKLSAGCDVRAELSNINQQFFNKTSLNEVDNGVIKSIKIMSGGRCLVPTGLYLQIPDGFELMIRPRSGLALKNGIFILNSPGCVDADYTGEIGIIIANFGAQPFVINQGERIAQLVLNPVNQINFKKVENLTKTERGEGGFGHTGTK